MKQKNNKNKGAMKLSKKRLTRDEYHLYESFGEVDYSQDWLELFTPAVIGDLFIIMRSCSDNTLKANAVIEELSDIGFAAVGEGTNILTLANPTYPGVIFKVALDDNGLADNYNDEILENLVNECLGEPRYTHVLAKHPSGMVSVQERKVVVTSQDRMDSFRASILKALTKLAAEYLIVDLAPSDFHLNYGIERNGDWCFIDASDLYPLVNLPKKIRCTRPIQYDEKHHKVIRCNGKLRYTADFSQVYCPDCHGTFIPSELRPNDKEDKNKMAHAMMDGMSAKEREDMRTEQVVRIGGKVRTIVVDEPTAEKPTKGLPTVENPETMVVRPVTETTDKILGRFRKPDEDDIKRVETVKVQEELIMEPSTGVPMAGPDDDDEEEEVARSGVREPAAEAVADLEPVSENPVAINDDDDDDDLDEPEYRSTMDESNEDDEDDDEPHMVNATGIDGSATRITEEAATFDYDDEEEDGPAEPEPEDLPEALEGDLDDAEEVTDEDEVNIYYTIVEDDLDPEWGLHMTIVGDPMTAMLEHALPLYVTIGDQTRCAIGLKQMQALLRPVIEEIMGASSK